MSIDDNISAEASNLYERVEHADVKASKSLASSLATSFMGSILIGYSQVAPYIPTEDPHPDITSASALGAGIFALGATALFGLDYLRASIEARAYEQEARALERARRNP